MDSPVEADIVTGVPESEMPLLLVIQFESGRFHTARHLSKNGYVGGTFIKPKQSKPKRIKRADKAQMY